MHFANSGLDCPSWYNFLNQGKATKYIRMKKLNNATMFNKLQKNWSIFSHTTNLGHRLNKKNLLAKSKALTFLFYFGRWKHTYQEALPSNPSYLMLLLAIHSPSWNFTSFSHAAHSWSSANPWHKSSKWQHCQHFHQSLKKLLN